MLISNIFTKYLLSPKWVQILIFLIIYYIIIKFHYFDLDFSTAECMQRGGGHRPNPVHRPFVPAASSTITKEMYDALARRTKILEEFLPPMIAEAKTAAVSEETEKILNESVTTRDLCRSHMQQTKNILCVRDDLERHYAQQEATIQSMQADIATLRKQINEINAKLTFNQLK